MLHLCIIFILIINISCFIFNSKFKFSREIIKKNRLISSHYLENVKLKSYDESNMNNKTNIFNSNPMYRVSRFTYYIYDDINPVYIIIANKGESKIEDSPDLQNIWKKHSSTIKTLDSSVQTSNNYIPCGVRLNTDTLELVDIIKLNNINFVLIDKELFSYTDIMRLGARFNINNIKLIFNEPLIFNGTTKFIGSTFEFYQIISNF
jgi:hypothetical protein